MNRSLNLVLGFLLMTACAKDRVMMLTERAEAYNRGLRWSSLTAVGPLINEGNRRSVMERLSRDLGMNRIVDFSIVDLGLDDAKKSGSIVVEYSYYGITSQDVRYRQEIQTWKYEPKQKAWFLYDFKPITSAAPR